MISVGETFKFTGCIVSMANWSLRANMTLINKLTITPKIYSTKDVHKTDIITLYRARWYWWYWKCFERYIWKYGIIFWFLILLHTKLANQKIMYVNGKKTLGEKLWRGALTYLPSPACPVAPAWDRRRDVVKSS